MQQKITNLSKKKALRSSGMPPQRLLDNLHPDIAATIDFLEPVLDQPTLQDYAWYLAETVSNSSLTSFGEKTYYGSRLSILNDPPGQPIYNLDEIPLDVYDKMRRDPQISLGLSLITLPICSRPWTFKCEIPKQKAFIEEVLRQHLRSILATSLLSIIYGFSPHEKVFGRGHMTIRDIDTKGKVSTFFDDEVITLLKVKSIYPGSVRVTLDKKDNLNGFVQSATKDPFIKISKSKMYWFANSVEFGNWYGQSRLKNIYKVWYWGELFQQFMLRYFERKGSPTAKIYVPPGESRDSEGNTVANIDIAAKIVRMITENSAVVVPSIQKEGERIWEVEYLQDDKRGEMFIEALNYFNTMKLRGILVPERTLTQDSASGSFSMASAHTDVFWLSEEGLIAELEEAINRQIVHPLLQMNFPKADIFPCRLVIDELDWDRKVLVKEIYTKLIAYLSTVARQGKAPNVMPHLKEMADILEIPVATFDDQFSNKLEPLNAGPGGAAPTGGKKPRKGASPVGRGAPSTRRPASKR